MRKSEYIREKIQEGLKDSFFTNGETSIRNEVRTERKRSENTVKTYQKPSENRAILSQNFVTKQPKKVRKRVSYTATLSKNFVDECIFLNVKPYELQSWCVVELRNRRART